LRRDASAEAEPVCWRVGKAEIHIFGFFLFNRGERSGQFRSFGASDGFQSRAMKSYQHELDSELKSGLTKLHVKTGKTFDFISPVESGGKDY
jgi:hypothetical protein